MREVKKTILFGHRSCGQRNSFEKRSSEKLIGAHVSTSGGVYNAIENGEILGCNAIQIFSRNQRQWDQPALSSQEICRFREQWKDSRLRCIVAHNSYLPNLASPSTEIVEKSLAAFEDEIRRAEALGLMGVVFHPGSHLGTGEKEGLKRIISNLDRVMEQTQGMKARLIVETTSGTGSNLGYRFEHISKIIGGVKDPSRMGICLDTCHIFCAGYDIRTQETYKAAVEAMKSAWGEDLEKIMVIHFNDSQHELGSRKDRHERIGKGEIGKNAFGYFLNDYRFKNVPMILEIPGGDEAYTGDLNLLGGLIKY